MIYIVWKESGKTCTCQFSGSSSLETQTTGSSSGTIEVPSFRYLNTGLRIHEMRPIRIKASSCQWVFPFKRKLNSFHRVAFLHLCSKFIRTSYAAGPSTLQCKSCQGCLGALVPAWEGRNRIWISSKELGFHLEKNSKWSYTYWKCRIVKIILKNSVKIA